MDDQLKEHFHSLESKDDTIRLNAFQTLLKITENKVTWADEVWNNLLQKLDNENSYQRSIGIMLLCNLAKSVKVTEVKPITDKILAHTQDEKFITSRQCLQNIWKLAIIDEELQNQVLNHLKKQFEACELDKHYNLIRQDIIQTLKQIADQSNNYVPVKNAIELINKEKNEKFRKKYLTILGKK